MKLVCGVGIYDLRDDPSHITNKKIGGKIVWTCPFYRKWKDLLRRCYSEKFLQGSPTYRGCSVCEEWKTFSNFMAWMKTQPWNGKELDKDILIPGNKIYSPETCVFVSPSLNSLLGTRMRSTGGVRKSNKKFEARVSLGDKSLSLGVFATIEQAKAERKKHLSKHILDVAENLTEDDTSDIEKTRQGLIRHVEEGSFFK